MGGRSERPVEMPAQSTESFRRVWEQQEEVKSYYYTVVNTLFIIYDEILNVMILKYALKTVALRPAYPR